MSWYSRTWCACLWHGCEREILKNRAVEAGWFERPEGGWLCPWHSPDKPYYDVQARAAGERQDEHDG